MFFNLVKKRKYNGNIKALFFVMSCTNISAHSETVGELRRSPDWRSNLKETHTRVWAIKMYFLVYIYIIKRSISSFKLKTYLFRERISISQAYIVCDKAHYFSLTCTPDMHPFPYMYGAN